jgi:hypothetical protein
MTLTFTVAADVAVWTDKITNAVKIELKDNLGGNTETATLETLNITNFTPVNFFNNTVASSLGLVVSTGDSIQLTTDQRLFQLGTSNSNAFTKRIVKNFVVTLHVADSGSNAVTSTKAVIEYGSSLENVGKKIT